MAEKENKRDIILTLSNELCKEYIVYDSNDRITYLYQAPTDAEDGEPCLKVSYEYASGVSVLAVKRKEEKTTWTGTWDI